MLFSVSNMVICSCLFLVNVVGNDRIFLSLQVLVCAPSNVAVDQLAEKISATGLKVLETVS